MRVTDVLFAAVWRMLQALKDVAVLLAAAAPAVVACLLAAPAPAAVDVLMHRCEGLERRLAATFPSALMSLSGAAAGRMSQRKRVSPDGGGDAGAVTHCCVDTCTTGIGCEGGGSVL